MNFLNIKFDSQSSHTISEFSGYLCASKIQNIYPFRGLQKFEC